MGVSWDARNERAKFWARESRAWAGIAKQAVVQLNGLGIVELYTVLVTCANDDVIRSPTSSIVNVPILRRFSPLRANFSA